MEYARRYEAQRKARTPQEQRRRSMVLGIPPPPTSTWVSHDEHNMTALRDRAQAQVLKDLGELTMCTFHNDSSASMSDEEAIFNDVIGEYQIMYPGTKDIWVSQATVDRIQAFTSRFKAF